MTLSTTAAAVGCVLYANRERTSKTLTRIGNSVPNRLYVAAKAFPEPPTGGVKTVKGKLKNTACMPCPPCPPRGMCKNPCQEHQYNITSDPKCFSLFLTIHVNSSADPSCVSKVAADMRTLVCSVTDDDTEIDAGVGFGPNIWSQVYGKTCKNFYYTERKGLNGDMPATGGDIFLHAKCND